MLEKHQNIMERQKSVDTPYFFAENSAAQLIYSPDVVINFTQLQHFIYLLSLCGSLHFHTTICCSGIVFCRVTVVGNSDVEASLRYKVLDRFNTAKLQIKVK